MSYARDISPHGMVRTANHNYYFGLQCGCGCPPPSWQFHTGSVTIITGFKKVYVAVQGTFKTDLSALGQGYSRNSPHDLIAVNGGVSHVGSAVTTSGSGYTPLVGGRPDDFTGAQAGILFSSLDATFRSCWQSNYSYFWSTDGNTDQLTESWVSNAASVAAGYNGLNLKCVTVGTVSNLSTMDAQAASLLALIDPANEDIYYATYDNPYVLLSWNPVAGATSYKIKRNVGGGSYSVIATGVGTNQYRDNAISNGSVYGYKVVAVVGGVDSADSAAITLSPTIADNPISYTANPGYPATGAAGSGAPVNLQGLALNTQFQFGYNYGSVISSNSSLLIIPNSTPACGYVLTTDITEIAPDGGTIATDSYLLAVYRSLAGKSVSSSKIPVYGYSDWLYSATPPYYFFYSKSTAFLPCFGYTSGVPNSGRFVFQKRGFFYDAAPLNVSPYFAALTFPTSVVLSGANVTDEITFSFGDVQGIGALYYCSPTVAAKSATVVAPGSQFVTAGADSSPGAFDNTVGAGSTDVGAGGNQNL